MTMRTAQVALMQIGKIAILFMAWVTLSVMPLHMVAAQGATPSDTELGAAYCLGFTTTARELAQRTGMPVSPEALQESQRETTRFSDYLIAKGYMTTDRDPFPVLLARKHGNEDAAQCFQNINKDAEACNKQCAPQCKAYERQCGNCLQSCDRSTGHHRASVESDVRK